MDFNENGLTFIRVSNIDIPESVQFPYLSGDEKLDKIFSETGGLVPSQSILFTGEPGAGKTTFICYYGSEIANNINENDHLEFEDGSLKNSGPVVLISLEMSDIQIKGLSRRIPHLNNLLILKTENDVDYQEWLNKLIDIKPSLVILDSIQKLAEMMADNNDLLGRRKNKSILRYQKEICIMFNKFSKITYTPVVLIGHTNKRGQYLGPTGIKHELDTHLEINIDKQNRQRKIKTSKNRWGPEIPEITMNFEKDGLSFESGFLEIATIANLPTISNNNSIPETLLNLFNVLKDKYKERLIANKITPDNIKLNFTSTRNFKSSIIEDGINNIAYIEVGERKIALMGDETWSKYNDENRYMKQLCNTKKDKIVWMFIHEFCHLFRDGKNHNLQFFQKVFEIAKQNKEFFSYGI